MKRISRCYEIEKMYWSKGECIHLNKVQKRMLLNFSNKVVNKL